MAKKKGVSQVVFVFLVAALATAWLPLIRIEVPPVGKKSLGIRDLVSSLSKAAQSGKSGEGASLKVKMDPDFFDVIEKVLPQKSKAGSAPSGAPAKVSPTFVLALLVPISLAAAYLLALIEAALAAFKQIGAFKTASLVALASSAYALVGTIYLSRVVQETVNKGIADAGEKLFGIFSKEVMPQITLAPDKGLYALLAASALVFVTGLLAKKA